MVALAVATPVTTAHPSNSSVIVKNPSGEPISPVTLQQAGTMAICNSRAWEAKIVTSAYWVYHDQVSKTAPTGEYLVTGSFMVRGKKNYLPPSQLVYGFGLLFRVAEECVGRHLHERRPELRGGSGDGDGDGGPDSSSVSSLHAKLQMLDVRGDGEEADESDSSLRVKKKNKSRDAATRDNDNNDNNKTKTETSAQPAQKKKTTTTTTTTTMTSAESIPSPARKADDTMSILTMSADKYELDTYETAEEPATVLTDVLQSTEIVSEESKQRRKYTSAKSRKKGKSKDEEVEVDGGAVTATMAATPATIQGASLAEMSSNDDNDDNDDDNNHSKAPNSSGAPLKPVRGKKKKLKKMKEKYGHQDEEERALRMQLLASVGTNPAGGAPSTSTNTSTSTSNPAKGGKQTTVGSKDAKRGGEKSRGVKGDKLKQPDSKTLVAAGPSSSASSSLASQPALPPSAITAAAAATSLTAEGEPDDSSANKVSLADADADANADQENASESDQDDDQDQDHDNDEDDRDEIQRLLQEENVAGLPDADELEDPLTYLDSLTGNPISGGADGGGGGGDTATAGADPDILLSVVPVCAPFAVLQNYKYRVKLIPGSMKKGKATKTVLAALLARTDLLTQRERELIKSIPEPDLMNAMLAKVKVLAPGVAEQQNKNRRSGGRAKGRK